MINNISKKAKFLGMMMAMAIGSFNSLDVSASDVLDKEIVTDDVNLNKRTFIKAFENINIYSDVNCTNVIGKLNENQELPLNCLWDEGYYEVEYNNGIGFVECNKCGTTLKYTCDYMVEVINDTNLYKDDNTEYQLNKQDVGMLLKRVGSYAMIKVDDTIGYVDAKDIKVLTDTFVVIDLSDQNLYLYQNGNLILESPVITGRDKSPTDVGDFSVYEKRTNYTMIGANNSYRSFAKYVTKFNDKSCEYIHDASWRSKEEFENRKLIRKQNGSHGCTNAPLNTAQKVYETCNIGDNVIVRP